MTPDTVTPQPTPDAAPPPTDPAGWIYVRDLPTPPELARLIESSCRRRGFHRWWRRRWRDWLTDDLKLRYHYADKLVAYTSTDRGPAIIAVGDDWDSPPIAGLCARLPRELNERTILEYVIPIHDDTSCILTGNP